MTANFESWMNRNFVHVAYQSLLALCLVLLLRAGCGRNCPQPVIAREEKVTKADTTDKVIAHAPVHVEGTAKITPRPRRAITSKLPDNRVADSVNDVELPDNRVADSLEPFTASLDTTVGKDSIHAKYYYPENQFRIEFKRAADTVQVINTTTEVTRYIDPDWYEKPSFTVPATAVTILAIIFGVR